MYYSKIIYEDVVNGDGLRTTLFVSGCTLNCKGCHNKQSQNFRFGELYTEQTKNKIIESLNNEYVDGLSISGGDPLEPKNFKDVLELCKSVKELYPNKTIWLYTGYQYEQLLFEGKFDVVYILKNCDVVVDGKYIDEKRDVSLKWRGSSNQRVLDMKKCIDTGREVLYCD